MEFQIDSKNKFITLNFAKTPETQSQRKKEGLVVEEFARDDLLGKIPKEFQITINPNEGIDLYLHDGIILNVEVKGANRFEHAPKNKTGKTTGRFTIKALDYTTSDFFAFLVKEVDDDFQWKMDEPRKFIYVGSDTFREFLIKRHKRIHKKQDLTEKEIDTILSKDYKISIKDVENEKRLPRIDPSKYFLKKRF